MLIHNIEIEESYVAVMKAEAGEFDHRTGEIKVNAAKLVSEKHAFDSKPGRFIVIRFSVTHEGETKEFEAATKLVSTHAPGVDPRELTILGQVVRLEISKRAAHE